MRFKDSYSRKQKSSANNFTSKDVAQELQAQAPQQLLLPPWQQKIFSSTMAAMGRQLKQSVKVFHSLILYRLLPAQKEMACKEDHPPHGTLSLAFCVLQGILWVTMA